MLIGVLGSICMTKQLGMASKTTYHHNHPQHQLSFLVHHLEIIYMGNTQSESATTKHLYHLGTAKMETILVNIVIKCFVYVYLMQFIYFENILKQENSKNVKIWPIFNIKPEQKKRETA